MSVYVHECPHEETRIRRKTISGGAVQIKRQCLQCGRSIGNAIAKSAAPTPLEEWDVELEEGHEQNILKASRVQESVRDQELREKDAAWWRRYNDYLRSPAWRSKRELVFRRDAWLCQACLINRAEEVHHLTYRHVFDEPLFDLRAVCHVCHGRITERDRSPEYMPAAAKADPR